MGNEAGPDLWGSRIGLRKVDVLVLHLLDAGVPDSMEAMRASLVYLPLRQVLQMLTQLGWNGGAKDVISPRGSADRP